MENSKWVKGVVFVSYFEMVMFTTSMFVIQLTKVVLMSFSDEHIFIPEVDYWKTIIFGIFSCFVTCFGFLMLQALKESYSRGLDKMSVSLRKEMLLRNLHIATLVTLIISSLYETAKAMIKIGMSTAVVAVVVLVRGIILLVVWKYSTRLEHEKSVSSPAEFQYKANLGKDKDTFCEPPHVV